MKTASLAEIKKELKELAPGKIAELCLRLAGFSKNNKELLNYLLFEAQDESAYISAIKEEVRDLFTGVNKTSLYQAKKTIRKIVRTINKYVRYSGQKETQVELLIFFCEELKATKLPIHQSKVLVNLYRNQLDVIQKALVSLHDDLQFDYQERITAITP